MKECEHCGYDGNWILTHHYKCPNHPCETTPYPTCNGAEGCDTCEHQLEE